MIYDEDIYQDGEPNIIYGVVINNNKYSFKEYVTEYNLISESAIQPYSYDPDGAQVGFGTIMGSQQYTIPSWALTGAYTFANFVFNLWGSSIVSYSLAYAGFITIDRHWIRYYDGGRMP